MKNKISLMAIMLISLLSLPKINFGQAINLGAATNFVIFTEAGAVGDNASSHSHLIGDVGYEISGAITGFGNVNGVMHPGVDAATTDAGSALSNAITQINARTVNFFPASGTLGNGQTLIAGVYSIPGSATQNLNLYLDAQGDPNAEFIIKIGGTFNAVANSKVILLNGALACHVYWEVTDMVGIATGVVMKGNIISGGAITTGVLDSLEGRLLTTVGAINIDGLLGHIPLGCGSLPLTGPKAPNLASAGCYTVFSSIGALANTAPTNITGDVGKNNNGDAITGWLPAYVTGTLHSLQDASTIQCAIDLSNAYDTLNALVPDITLLYPAQFGNNLVLTPHTYVMNGAATFTDTLYLDAQNNPNGVFVIKILAGALSTSTYSKVNLINGAQAKNVFWMVQGQVDINNYSVFCGTIIVPVGAINLVNTGVVLNGRALTMNGAITTTGLTATSSCTPPVITFQSGNQTICQGNSANLTVISTGTNLTYQWRKGKVNLINGPTISGVNSATLNINPLKISDSSSYYNVIVTGTSLPNDTSIYISLLVNAAPNIIVQAIDQTVCSGSTASFIISANGKGLTYQWRKGITPLSNNVNVSGVTSSTLTINAATISDTSSKYNVIVSGTCTPKDTSLNFLLAVNTAPTITLQPASTVVCSGSTASFTVAAIGTALTYKWRKGITPLSNGINVSGATSATLTINAATVSDTSSQYNVIVSGICTPKDTSINFSLAVNTAPTITLQPSSVAVCVGSSASFTVVAIGTGLTYQWRKGSIPLSNGVNVSGVTSATLTINAVTLSDTSSQYNAIVSGTCIPKDTSINVTLSINLIPIAVANVNTPVCIGSPINLTAQTVSGGIYNWAGANGYSSSAQNPVIAAASSANAGSYSLTVSSNGCVSAPVTTVVVINNCADLSVIKTVNNSHPIIGHNVIFTIVANNNGPDNATGVLVTDSLQSGYSYVSSTTTAGMYNPSTGVWTIGSLNNSTSQTLTITAMLIAKGNYINTAIINSNDVDTNTGNNTSTIETQPTDFNIPEGFSPNSDGINDLFVVRGINNYPANTFSIYNRWGNEVFSANNYQNTWDGKSTKGVKVGGDELPIGTYFYVLDLGDGSDIFKGTIYLNK